MADNTTAAVLDAAAGRSITHSAEARQIEQPHQGGLPQFEFDYWGGQIVWLAVVFAILYLAFAKVFIPRLRRVADERAKTISDAVASARAVQTQADAQAETARKALDEARLQTQRTAAEAKAKAQDEAKTRQAALEAELHAKLADADARIRASRDQAMAGVSQVASESAAAIVEKFTGLAPEAGELAAAQG